MDGFVVKLLRHILRRIFLRFLRTLVTTDRDLFSTHGHFDSAIVDCPITDRTFARVHEFVSLVNEFENRRRQTTTIGDLRLPDSCLFRPEVTDL